MDAKNPVPDPHGKPSFLRWDVSGTMNGSNGTYQLVVDTATKGPGKGGPEKVTDIDLGAEKVTHVELRGGGGGQ
jgi:hypothetical protein